MTPTLTPTDGPLHHFDAAGTAALLPFAPLVEAIAEAAGAHQAGRIVSPDRLVLPMADQGVLLSMPATAPDLAIHKLVSVVPGNAARGLPTIHGVVTVCDAATGRPLFLLDGPVVTGRRTAAVSLLAMRLLLPAPPTDVLLIGTGTQAVHHVHALFALHPDVRLWVQGRDAGKLARFCAEQAAAAGVSTEQLRPCRPADDTAHCQAVVLLTTARSPVYDETPRAGRLVLGVGAFKPEMAEIGPRTLAGSRLQADDVSGARHEAGDLIQAGVDFDRVASLADLLRHPPDLGQAQVFKSVGSAAWDLAAARVAVRELAARSDAPPA